MKRFFSTALFLILITVAFGSTGRRSSASSKLVTLQSRGLSFQVETTAESVGDVLAEQGYTPTLSPPISRSETGGDEEGVLQGTIIKISKPVSVTINDGGTESQYTSSAETIGDLLFEQKIGLAATDRVTPVLGTYLGEGLKITIDRIVDLEVAETHEIPYEIKIQHNPEVYYGRESVLSEGALGQKEQNFLITYKNGVEIKRKLLSQKVAANPVTEVREFGTKIEIEDEKEGRASWYAYKGCMCAAYPVLMKGRYVRVFDLDTDKSIIVQINDLGPEQAIFPDRVIDLDSVAYKQLAPLTTGTIRVKVEVLKN